MCRVVHVHSLNLPDNLYGTIFFNMRAQEKRGGARYVKSCARHHLK